MGARREGLAPPGVRGHLKEWKLLWKEELRAGTCSGRLLDQTAQGGGRTPASRGGRCPMCAVGPAPAPGAVHGAGLCEEAFREVEHQQYQKPQPFWDPDIPWRHTSCLQGLPQCGWSHGTPPATLQQLHTPAPWCPFGHIRRVSRDQSRFLQPE